MIYPGILNNDESSYFSIENKIGGYIAVQVSKLNYREKSILACVQLMSQITRESTIASGRIGHFELAGYIQLKHCYEFANMIYGGMLGLPFRRGNELENFDMEKVRTAYRLLCEHNPMLLNYLTNLDMAESIVEHHVKENSKHHVSTIDNWRDHIMMPNKRVGPFLIASVPLNQLVIGM